MTLYYQDESLTLYCGDSLEILPTLDVTADVLLTDPPYFKVKQDEWDNQWDKAHEFLGWMGEWIDHAKPLLAPHASVWVFASPAMTSSVERVVAEQFRVLNSIRWVKDRGTHSRIHVQDLRRYIPAWEGLILGEQHGTEESYQDQCLRLWGEVAAPLREHIERQRVIAGLTRRYIDSAWQAKRRTKGMMTPHWFGVGQWQLPGETAYEWMRTELGMGLRPYHEARQEYDELRAEFYARRKSLDSSLRRHFDITDRGRSTDVWTFPSVKPYPGKHPCEKPQDMLTHMIETSSRPGWTILDPFAGSGSTLLAARNTGRKAIGIEKDEKWCKKIAQRLSENTLELGATA